MTAVTSQEYAMNIEMLAADPLPAASQAFSIHTEQVALEGGTNPDYGTVQWRTLIDGTPCTPKEFILGLAEMGPHGTLPAHRHEPAEFHLGLEGTGIVTIEGVPHQIKAGVAIYLPANAEHSVLAGPDGLRFAYGFAEGNYQAIQYNFSK